MEANISIEGLMSGLFLGTETSWDCSRVVRRVEEQASVGDELDDELEPADRWHRCMDVVRQEWEQWKSESPELHAWHRRRGNETDNRKHLEDVMMRLGDTWRARDYLLSVMDCRDDDRGGVICSQACDLRPMALFMLSIVRAEELEAEGIRVTKAVRAKYGDAGMPDGLEGLLGGERSVLWWMRETALDGR